ncbi:hypothetical protein H8M03_12155 [Sphingomonas sabuli]|uniref:EthD domain-containing protein n=1 Tax=Sphingomonas sabuli TaxID=2764186 RepID=A0A7G9L276_9SPHN|nr:hypothetical protein [Sphingomonas sabuli]QNM82725.1 hypothetical protein H8M03_12155 [Sphingomonas sabuli]
MKGTLAFAAAALGLAVSSVPAVAQAPDRSVTAEYYYRIKWGSAAEFKQLYERNHAPILREMQKQGFILGMEVEEPFTHLAGGPRWDLRVTIRMRDAESAIGVGGEFDKAVAATTKRLYPDKEKFLAEEARRFSLLEEHWDVIVAKVEP